MKKQLLCTAVLAAIGATASTSANAALASDATLNFNPGTAGGNYGFIVSGSYFGMDGNGDGNITKPERVAISQNDGLFLGTVQGASGSHLGAPGCVNDVPDPIPDPDTTTCNNTGENPGIDNAWGFFGNTGMHQSTSAVNVTSASGDTANLDFSGWSVTWNGIADIPMSGGAHSGGTDGVAVVTCAAGSGCASGSTYTLDYYATVPVGDPSNFGGVKYLLHLDGVIGDAPAAIPVPAAVWLFGSGLLGLVGVARRRKVA